MSNHRFGKRRVSGCQCEFNYTCGPCLRNLPPYFYTPSTPSEETARSEEEFLEECAKADLGDRPDRNRPDITSYLQQDISGRVAESGPAENIWPLKRHFS